jgi:hypothetical protein
MCTEFWSGSLKEIRLGKPRCRWEYNIKMDHRETRMEKSVGLMSWDRDTWWAFVNTLMNLGGCGEFHE